MCRQRRSLEWCIYTPRNTGIAGKHQKRGERHGQILPSRLQRAHSSVDTLISELISSGTSNGAPKSGSAACEGSQFTSVNHIQNDCFSWGLNNPAWRKYDEEKGLCLFDFYIQAAKTQQTSQGLPSLLLRSFLSARSWRVAGSYLWPVLTFGLFPTLMFVTPLPSCSKYIKCHGRSSFEPSSLLR